MAQGKFDVLDVPTTSSPALLEISGIARLSIPRERANPIYLVPCAMTGTVGVDEAVRNNVWVFVTCARSKRGVARTSPKVMTARSDAGSKGDQAAGSAS